MTLTPRPDRNSQPAPEQNSAMEVLIEKIVQLEASQLKLIAKIGSLGDSHWELKQQLTLLEAAQNENVKELKAIHDDFLQQLADTLNNKKPSNLEPLLEKFTTVLQNVGFQVEEQRHAQTQLSQRIQQVLTAQQVIELLNDKQEQAYPPDNA